LQAKHYIGFYGIRILSLLQKLEGNSGTCALKAKTTKPLVCLQLLYPLGTEISRNYNCWKSKKFEECRCTYGQQVSGFDLRWL